jgi:hypothetical protein
MDRKSYNEIVSDPLMTEYHCVIIFPFKEQMEIYLEDNTATCYDIWSHSFRSICNAGF